MNVCILGAPISCLAVAALALLSMPTKNLSAQTLVRDINLGSPSSSPFSFTEFGGQVFFRANDGASGVELWKSDGSGAGTTLVKDINPGAGHSSPNNFVEFGGLLYFTANDGSNGVELWRTDGTAAGTIMAVDIRAGSGSSSPSFLVVIGSTLFFSADDGVSGRELWKSDGSAAGTVRVTDIHAGSASSNPSQLTTVGSTLYFSANDGTRGIELWRSLAPWITATTSLVADINPGAVSSSPSNIVAQGATIYFRATDATSGSELWKSDGSSAGTMLVADINPGSANSNPNSLTVLSTFVFFSATDAQSGIELWKSDGTTTGTTMVKDIQAGSLGSNCSNFVVSGSNLFFTANDGMTGQEVWASRAPWIAATTNIVKDINPGTASGIPPSLSRVTAQLLYSAADNVRIVFSGTDGVRGSELWVSDGTSAGTKQVGDVNPGAGNAAPQGFTRVGANVFLSANDGTSGIEVYKAPLMSFGGALAETFGVGCAGSANLVPMNGAQGLPLLGNTSFSLELRQALGNSAAAAILDVQRGNVVLPGGCVLYVPQLIALFAAPTNAMGEGSVALPVPNQASLLGAHFFTQWACIDPQGSFLQQFSFSDGLEVVIGN